MRREIVKVRETSRAATTGARLLGPEAGLAVPHVGAAPALSAGWREGLAIVNLRGDPADPLFVMAASAALRIELPLTPCRTATHVSGLRVVWAGPDDWFVIAPPGRAGATAAQLHSSLAHVHHAVTDVSSGYTVLGLSGGPAREVLAGGCPLDLHPREFQTGMSAGSHYFKASVWLWQTDNTPSYEMLVRRSFMSYVWLMLERSTTFVPSQ